MTTTNKTTQWLAEEITDEPTGPHLRTTNAGAGAGREAVEQHNQAAVDDDEQRWRNHVVGTTEAGANRAALELQKATEAANAERRAQLARGGGSAVTSALRGDAGAAVHEVLREDLPDAAADRVLRQLADESRALEDQRTVAARDAKLAELVATAFDAALSKRGTTPVLPAFVRWFDHERPAKGLPLIEDAARQAVRAKRVIARRERIAERLTEIDAVVVEFASEVLAAAKAAHEVLTTAGLSPDSTSDEVLATLDIEAQKAWHAWRSAVSEWSDVQSARRYIATEGGRGGVSTGRGAYALTTEGGVDIPAEVWSNQFVGALLPTWVTSAHEALKWWIDQGCDAAPRGVQEQTSSTSDDGNDQ